MEIKPTPFLIAKRVLLLIVGAFTFGGLFIFVEALRAPVFQWIMVRHAFVLLAFYTVCIVFSNWIIFGWLFGNKPSPDLTTSLVVRALVGFVASAVVTTWAGGHLIRFIYPDLDVLNLRQYILISFYCLAFGLPAFLYMAVRDLWHKALEKVKEKEVAQARLEKELLAAQLKALQAQTNPHFLFNTLNSIASLISSDPAKAESTVERLSGLFRYALESHEGTSVSLEEEIRAVEDYLAIEKVRFGERLNYRLEVDRNVSACRVPPLILQPLVENAVKHGVSHREEASLLEVSVSQCDGKVLFRVDNEGPAPNIHSSEGVGLKNLHSRCHALYRGDFRFNLWQPRPGVTRAELELPIKPHGV